MTILRNLIFVGLATLAFSTHATPIVADTTYDLSNHPSGSARPPLYGLRLDGLTTGNQNDIFTFDFNAPGAAMTMFWDSGANSLSISGTAYGGRNSGNAYAPGQDTIWDILFTYTDLYECGSSLCANDGNGSIESAAFGAFDLVAESGNNSYAFQLGLNHRGFSGISGWGWMNHCPATDTPNGGSCYRHLYSSDWLFTATRTAVPEPAPLALMSLGLIAMGLVGRRRKQG